MWLNIFLSSIQILEHKNWCVLSSGAYVLVRQTTDVAFMRRHQPLQIVSAGSKTETLLSWAESISHAVGASAKICLSSANIAAQNMYESKNIRANPLQTPRPVKKAPGSEAEMWWPIESPMSLFLTILLYFYKGSTLKQFYSCQISFGHHYLDGKWWVVFLVLLSTYKNFHLVFLPHPNEERKWENSLSSTWQREKMNPL